jgi:hypothetical protein
MELYFLCELPFALHFMTLYRREFAGSSVKMQHVGRCCRAQVASLRWFIVSSLELRSATVK